MVAIIGMSITTGKDSISYLFEPSAPPILERLRTLDELHLAGIGTFAMLAPLLPECEYLPDLLVENVDFVILDRMNHEHADLVITSMGWKTRIPMSILIWCNKRCG